jgi:hypothetical protein
MRFQSWIPILGLAVALGCDSGKPKGDLPPLHPTKGRVVRGGQPVSGGSLQLQPDPAVPNVTVTAEVKPDGTFEVQTLHTQSQKKAAGAPVGTYRATYMPALGDQTQGAGANPTPVSPAQTYTIKEGPNELTIELGKK